MFCLMPEAMPRAAILMLAMPGFSCYRCLPVLSALLMRHARRERRLSPVDDDADAPVDDANASRLMSPPHIHGD